MLFLIAKVILLACLFYFYGWFRGRGKYNQDGTYLLNSQVNRITSWAIPASLTTMVVLSIPIASWWGLADFITLVLCYWFGLACVGWGKYMRMGNNGDPPYWNCFAFMLWRGPLVTIFAGAYLYLRFHTGIKLGLSGLFMPIAYTIGWKIKSSVVNFRTGPEIAEGILMAFVGAMLALE